MRPYPLGERGRSVAIGFLGVATLIGGLIDWLPYRYSHYTAQLFSLAVGLLSGFFVAWCCIAIVLWIRARRSR